MSHPQPTPHPTSPASALSRLPLPTRSRFQPLLLSLILLALIPAGLLVTSRIAFENSEKTVALVMDYPALSQQAKETGQDPGALLRRYQTLGVNGVAVYEDVVASAIQRGEAYFLTGSELQARHPGVPGINPEWSYLRSIKPGTVERLVRRYGSLANAGPISQAAATGELLPPARYRPLPTTTVTVRGQPWVGWSVDPRYLPAGPNLAQIRTLQARGFVVVYRPYDDQRVRQPGADWPDVPFLSFTGSEVIGARNPRVLADIGARLGTRVPTIIENSPQAGLETLIEGRTAARMFSLNPSWQNNLTPGDVASKFALAARERTQRILYLRPFPTQGETEYFLTLLGKQLARSHIRVTRPVIENYTPNALLRGLSMIGPLAALLLLALSYPLPRVGLIVGGLALLGALGLNGGEPFHSLALVAAITFPALGLVLRRRQLTDWFLATGFSLLGVLFVSALGADKGSMLGLDPFSGVGLTLVLPIGLVLLSFLPRQDIRRTLADLFAVKLKVGDVVLLGLALALFAVAVSRRGNTSAVGVSGVEARIRQDLQDAVIRPRFKEVFGHPLLLQGLSGTLPGSLTVLALLGGLEGQASILNTFSHFHTPFLISTTRALIGLGAGLLLGLAAVWAVNLALRLWNTYGGWNPGWR
ncbi:hypothetical protein DAERI_020215 [Deinococcus aerius]|uniref:Uncharacterized protein n=2 Tax=Deinococcus TaxID=1298 RepID=A0A2I9DF26_9DEIO|nr:MULTISPECIES: DUF5693 family protein [Deinococcus]MBB5293923.1 hypothetical protein [Deinococcus metallilatus]GBF04618.1 hypothetical protein DAERI_020215 [Deinococcus aerius]GMA17855.1 hypothetical protein GCM10025871_41860 [Deinococcus metallilatus]